MSFRDIDREKIAAAERMLMGRSNTLGKDGYFYNEPFEHLFSIHLDGMFRQTPSTGSDFAIPSYDDNPSEGTVGTRYDLVRLHSYLPSGKTGPSTVQSFFTVSAAPASNSRSALEAVRLKYLIPPTFSVGRSNAHEADGYLRGFELALFPAKSTSGVGTALAADVSNGPISVAADPGAGSPNETEQGAGEEGFWYVDYANGIVRFSRPPLNGTNGVMNPNNVFGDINGNEVATGGAVTMFASFYHYTGEFGPNDSVQFVTVGDGYKSNGVFEGTNENVFQSAVDLLDGYNGGTVFVKEGDYHFNNAVELRENVNIIGLGGVNITKPVADSAFVVHGSNIDIEGLTILNNDPNTSGSCISLRGDSNLSLIEHINIRNNTLQASRDAYAIGFETDLFEVTFRDINVEDNDFTSTSVFLAAKGNSLDANQIMRSFDGINWQATSISTNLTASDFASDGRIWAATINDDKVYVSSDEGDNWTTVPLSLAGLANSVKYFRRWVLSTSNTAEVYTSEDGTNWTERLASLTETADGLAHDYHSTWIVVGGDVGDGHPTAYVSTNNAITWTGPIVVSATIGQTLFAVEFGKDAYGDNIWVAVGESGALYTSYDGTIWTDMSQGSIGFTSIAYGDGKWIATSNTNTIYLSTDTINWSPIPLPNGMVVNGVVRFIGGRNSPSWLLSGSIGGTTGCLAYSIDGRHWTITTPTDSSSDYFTGLGVRYEDATFIRDVSSSEDGYCDFDGLNINNNSFGLFGGFSVSIDGYNVQQINNLDITNNESIGFSNITINPSETVSNVTITNNKNIGTLSIEDVRDLTVDNNKLINLDIVNNTIDTFRNSRISNNFIDGYLTFPESTEKLYIYNNMIVDGIVARTDGTGIHNNLNLQDNTCGGLVYLSIINESNIDGNNFNLFTISAASANCVSGSTISNNRVQFDANIVDGITGSVVNGNLVNGIFRVDGLVNNSSFVDGYSVSWDFNSSMLNCTVSGNYGVSWAFAGLTSVVISNNIAGPMVMTGANNVIISNNKANYINLPNSATEVLFFGNYIDDADSSGATYPQIISDSSFIGNHFNGNIVATSGQDVNTDWINIRIEGNHFEGNCSFENRRFTTCNISNNIFDGYLSIIRDHSEILSVSPEDPLLVSTNISDNIINSYLSIAWHGNDTGLGPGTPTTAIISNSNICNNVISDSLFLTIDPIQEDPNYYIQYVMSGGKISDNIISSIVVETSDTAPSSSGLNLTLISDNYVGALSLTTFTASLNALNDCIVDSNRFTTISVSGVIFDTLINNNQTTSFTTSDDITNSTISNNNIDGAFSAGAFSASVINGNVMQSTFVAGAFATTTVSNNIMQSSFAATSLTSSTMINNSVTTSVSFSSAAAALNLSIFGNNRVGGALTIDSSSNATSHILKSVIADNNILGAVTLSASLTAGDATTALDNAVFSNNYISGAVTIADSARTVTSNTITDSTFIGNDMLSTFTVYGNLDNCSVCNNVVTGALAFDAMTDSVMSGNNMAASVDISSSTVSGTIFSENFIGTGLTFADLSGVAFVSNSVSGVMQLTAASEVTNVTSGCTISDNVLSSIDFNGVMSTTSFSNNTISTTFDMDVLSNSIVNSNYVGGSCTIVISTADQSAMVKSIIDSNIFASVLQIQRNAAASTTYLIDDSIISNNFIDGYASILTDGAGLTNSVISGNAFEGAFSVVNQSSVTATADLLTYCSVIGNTVTGNIEFGANNSGQVCISYSTVTNNVVTGSLFFTHASEANSTILSQSLVSNNSVFTDIYIISNASTTDTGNVVSLSTIYNNYCVILAIGQPNIYSGNASNSLISGSVISGNVVTSKLDIYTGQGLSDVINNSIITGNYLVSMSVIQRNTTEAGAAGDLISASVISNNRINGAVTLTQNVIGELLINSMIIGNYMASTCTWQHGSNGTSGSTMETSTIANNVFNGSLVLGNNGTDTHTYDNSSIIGNIFDNFTLQTELDTDFNNLLVLGNLSGGTFTYNNNAAGNLTLPPGANIEIMVAFNRFATWTRFAGTLDAALVWHSSASGGGTISTDTGAPTAGYTVNWT